MDDETVYNNINNNNENSNNNNNINKQNNKLMDTENDNNFMDNSINDINQQDEQDQEDKALYNEFYKTMHRRREIEANQNSRMIDANVRSDINNSDKYELIQQRFNILNSIDNNELEDSIIDQNPPTA